jgi:hypothetical protein
VFCTPSSSILIGLSLTDLAKIEEKKEEKNVKVVVHVCVDGLKKKKSQVCCVLCVTRERSCWHRAPHFELFRKSAYIASSIIIISAHCCWLMFIQCLLIGK